MTEAYDWHSHPDSDETFIVLEGGLFVDFDDSAVEILPGHMITVIRGVRHLDPQSKATAKLRSFSNRGSDNRSTLGYGRPGMADSSRSRTSRQEFLRASGGALGVKYYRKGAVGNTGKMRRANWTSQKYASGSFGQQPRTHTLVILVLAMAPTARTQVRRNPERGIYNIEQIYSIQVTLSLFTASLPPLNPISDWLSNPVARRVGRKRQRPPPSRLIENASAPTSSSYPKCSARDVSDQG